jgi:CBS domain-containing protein
VQTAVINYRVADFLKQHPPFQSIEEPDLVTLAGRGRVKFHEPDEYICWQGSAHTPFIFVIQQGTVSLWDESGPQPALRDIRGPGDMIGIERFHGSATSLHSAKAASEVMLYALNATDLESLLAKYPRARQYVNAQNAVSADYHAPDQRRGVHETFLVDLIRDRDPLTCPASASIREAARLMSQASASAIALSAGGRVTGVLSSEDVVRWAATGEADPSQPAQTIARAALVTVAPDTLVSNGILAMGESRAAILALTSDGSPRGLLQSLVTAASLAPAFGDDPVAILREIGFAVDASALNTLNQRARAWMLDQLAVVSSLDWLARFADLVNRGILARLLELSAENGHLWCFYDAAGRQELLTSVAPRVALVTSTPQSPARLHQIQDALTQCGYHSGAVSQEHDSATLAEWKTRFSGWMRDPIRTQVYHARPLFDLRPVHGPPDMWNDLESHLRAELQSEPGFLRLLAHDCLANLPPLTFYRDLVVEESGEESDVFRLEQSALRPLIDVGRVFGLAAGRVLGGSTRERFDLARRLLPAHESIFREAAETARVVLFHQARAGLRQRTGGSELPLLTLSRHDRQVLKSGFRSILRLLEFTAPCDWLEGL